jgi:ribosomal protein L12E/L44/L45/RPP1/RPP2
VHVASGVALDRLVAADVARQDADRQAIRDLLKRSDVREIATQAGLDIRKAEAAVSTLSGKDLQEAAAQARMAQEQLSGGGSVTITTTTLIIILLVVILLIVALK